jgi:hypothetical protein
VVSGPLTIETTITSLKRAQAVCDEVNRVPVAKRGMFAMVECRHSYSSLLHGAFAGYVGFTPCIVTSVDRAGIV